ncbi:MAG: hypothetical protein KKA79_01410 [Nanoarchaeota archaeon]|nr:hypothetical protein [Nanoarchaeota archaeon]
MRTITLEQIHKDLKFLKNEVVEIKEHMIDVDSIISKDEELLLKKARAEHKKGESISLKELEKELSGNVRS